MGFNELMHGLTAIREDDPGFADCIMEDEFSSERTIWDGEKLVTQEEYEAELMREAYAV